MKEKLVAARKNPKKRLSSVVLVVDSGDVGYNRHDTPNMSYFGL
jgi:hypothetical protein